MFLPEFNGVRILVVGDVMLDRYIFGTADRISPEGPVPVVAVESEECRPGGAANVAANISALGASCELLSLVGLDEGAKRLEGIMKKWNVKPHFITDQDATTIEKVRIVSNGQQIVRFDREQRFSTDKVSGVLTKFISLLEKYDMIVFSDYLKGTLIHIKDMVAAAREYGVQTVIDPKSKDFSIYAGADIITPNMHEFVNTVGAVHKEEDIHAKAVTLVDRYNIGSICLTRGSKGISLYSNDGEAPYHVSSTKQEVFDVSGAGDTVVAVAATAIAVGLPTKDAIELANIAAGVAVRRIGTSVITREDIRNEIAGHLLGSEKIVSWRDLEHIVQVEHSKGRKVVFTNGCFDILHIGHIGYLRRARELGAKLVVGVNSDKSVTRLKGEKRPINTINDRMLLLAALEFVDFVTSFTEDTPFRLIESICPKILVKGGDYSIEEIVGADIVQKLGGEVRVLPYIDGKSTTNIIESLERDRIHNN